MSVSYSYGLDKTSFKLNVKYDGDSYFLEAGYSDSTTLKYDEEYENDLPPFPPPSGIFPSYRIFREYEDRADELINTDIDLRAEPIANDTIIEYKLDILGSREENKDFSLQVPAGLLDDRITEIRVLDDVTTGDIINEDISDGALFEINNRFVPGFYIRVRFEKSESSVVNSDRNDEIYYLDGIVYSGNKNTDKVAVYRLDGTKQLELNGNQNSYDVSQLGRGVYFAYIYSGNNVVSMLKIVKL